MMAHVFVQLKLGFVEECPILCMLCQIRQEPSDQLPKLEALLAGYIGSFP